MAKNIEQKDLAKVLQLLKSVLDADGYADIRRLGGLTNHTYYVRLEDGREYVVRLPGEGTEQMIVRSDERISTELACRIGVDARMLYFGADGSKVTEYIPNAVTMSAETIGQERHIRQVAQVLRKMHSCGEDTGVPFEVFDMAASYEKLIRELNVPLFADYGEFGRIVMEIKKEMQTLVQIKKVPCHNDPLCENWVEGDGRMYLIDWEYAGMNDGMWDVADVSIEAGFSDAQNELLLTHYLGREPGRADWLHFRASMIYVDYLWCLWAKARVPYDGQSMEDWAVERYERMKDNIRLFQQLSK